MQQQPFLDWIVTCNEKWILQDNWQWLAQWMNQEEALLKAKHAPKKRSWSLFSDLLPVWSTAAFWIPAKPLDLRSVLSKSMTCTKNCNACSRNWSTEWAQFFSTTVPNCTSRKQRFKVEQISPRWFAYLTIFTWPLGNWLPLLLASWQHFAGKMLPQPAKGRKCFPRVLESQDTNFYTTRIGKLVSLRQKCFDCNGSYFD